MSIIISPSILSADIGNLDKAIDEVANANEIHVDVMDGHFVPNLTWGLPIAEAAVRNGTLPVDVHLMIEHPDRTAVDYAKAGARVVSFHVEAASAPITLARRIRAAGAQSAFAFKPTTGVEEYLPYLHEVDMVLIMTVEPGFGGQTFLEPTLDKVRAVRKWANEHHPNLQVQVDGGIAPDTIERAAAAGADVFVAGSAVYGASDPAGEVEKLRRLATASYGKDHDKQDTLLALPSELQA